MNTTNKKHLVLPKLNYFLREIIITRTLFKGSAQMGLCISSRIEGQTLHAVVAQISTESVAFSQRSAQSQKIPELCTI